MDLKINREQIPITERILSEAQEQGVELDYILPDYHPEIFRIIHCDLLPSVTEYQLHHEKLSYDLQVEVRILYCGNHDHRLQCVSQTLRYSKVLELPPRQEQRLSVSLSAKADYANCRAVSKRRLDVRGAVSVKIEVSAERTQEMISDIFGMYMQCQKKQITYADKKQQASKSCTLTEEIELPSTKPPLQTILRCTARAEQGDSSIIAGKFVARGEIIVSLLYTADAPEETTAETMQFSLPYSQILDMESIDESFTGIAEVQVVQCSCKPVADKNGVQRLLKCEADLRITCTAFQAATASVVTDAYSTTYLYECKQLPLQITGVPVPFQESITCSASLTAGDTPVDYIYDLHCRIKNAAISLLPEQNRVKISGMLCCCLLVRDADGMPFLLEKEEAFEEQFLPTQPVTQALLHAEAEPMDAAFHLSADGSISIKTAIQIRGTLVPFTNVVCVSAAEVDANRKRERDSDCAMRLYYGTIGESIWEIAKRCNTKVEAIAAENDLTGDTITKAGMLLIPIVY